MSVSFVQFLCSRINHFFKIDLIDDEVAQIKKKTSKKAISVTKTLQKMGKLQNKVFERSTTTYLIAKAQGILT